MPSEESIFKAACQIESSQEREAYVAQACGEDAVLRERIGRLLDAHDQETSFIDGRAGGIAVTIATPVTEEPGAEIGKYKLLQQIGEGGFGVVYMAEQTQPVRRKVALKIIKPGMDTKEVVARFESERQALALMDHPNIAQVFDAGTTDSGRPYFVMELVKGVPLNQFCDENSLSTQERLELFGKVCRAIQHAHQKGVIHRDLKPSNVMVTLHDNKPVPKVIDFGVSKAISQQLTEKTLFTAYGQMVGTPIYMSPEQAQMSGFDVDTRSDIYSLGVVLYELLTGSTPLTAERLRKSGYAEMQRLIREEEAPRPSLRLSTETGEAQALIARKRRTEPKHLSSLLRGDLDWIVVKALEKDRNRRYDTANSFADDIERFLKNDVVEACPPSVGYRLRKFAARNKGLVTTATIIAATLLIGIAATTWAAVAAIRARNDAEAAEELAKQNESLAEGERKKALDAAWKAEQESNRADRQRLEAETAKYAMQLKLADIHYDNFEMAAAQKLLTETNPEVRNWEYDFVKQRCDGRNRYFGEERVYTAVAITPDGKLVAGGGKHGAVELFEYNTGKRVAELKGDWSSVLQLAFSPDGQRLACTADNTICVWDVASHQQLGKLDFSVPEQPATPFNRLERSVAFDASGERLALGVDQEVQIWNGSLTKKHRTIDVGAGKVMQIAFDPVRDQIAVRHAPAGALVRRFGAVPSYALLIFDAGTGELRLKWTVDPNRGFVGYDPQGQQLLTSCIPGGQQVASAWDPKTGKTVVSPLTNISGLDHSGLGISYAAFSADGKIVALAPSVNNTMSIVDAQTGQIISTLSLPESEVGGMRACVINGMDMSVDGRRVVAATSHPFSRMGRGDMGRLTGITIEGDSTVIDLASQGRGNPGNWRYSAVCEQAGWIARGVSYPKRNIGESMVYDVTNQQEHFLVEFHSLTRGELLFCLRRHDRAFGRLLASHDGRSLLEFHGSTIEVWDPTTRRRKSTIHLDNPRDQVQEIAKLDRNDRLLATVEGNKNAPSDEQRFRLVVRDLRTGEVLWQTDPTIEVHEPKDFSLDGSQLLVGTRPQFERSTYDPKTGRPNFDFHVRMQVFDARSGELLSKTKETLKQLRGARFIAPRRVIATTWYGLQSWDIDTGKLTPFCEQGGSFEIIRDGTRLMVASKGTLHVFDIETMQEVYQMPTELSAGLYASPSGSAIVLSGMREPRLLSVRPSNQSSQ